MTLAKQIIQYLLQEHEGEEGIYVEAQVFEPFQKSQKNIPAAVIESKPKAAPIQPLKSLPPVAKKQPVQQATPTPPTTPPKPVLAKTKPVFDFSEIKNLVQKEFPAVKALSTPPVLEPILEPIKSNPQLIICAEPKNPKEKELIENLAKAIEKEFHLTVTINEKGSCIEWEQKMIPLDPLESYITDPSLKKSLWNTLKNTLRSS
jgi:hypothetical protein